MENSHNPIWTFITEPVDLHLPDFSEFTPERLADAAHRATDFLAQEIQAIISNPEAPSFHNTTLAHDAALSPVNRLWPVVRLIESALADTAWHATLAQVRAQLSKATVAVELNTELFRRLENVPTVHLNPEDMRHHELLLADFVHAGARLDDETRERVATLRQEISALETEFGQFVQQETQDCALHIAPDSPLSLAGLSESQLAAAAAEAEARNLPGHVIALMSPTNQPLIESLTDPETRSALFAASANRGARGNDTDTRGTVTDLTALRAALAGAMGYKSFSDYELSTQMAGNPDEATALILQLLQPALKQLNTEIDTVRQAYAPERLEAEDLAFYLAKYAAEHYHADAGEVAKYFELERVFEDGVLYAASQLYGVRFERTDETAWHPDVTVFRAYEGERELGVIAVDPYARSTKRGGAWMDQIVSFGRFTGERPIISLTMNIPKPPAGQPALLSMDEVTTFFHEFGHVVHGLFANSNYPSRSGTSVPRDYVEFPSQLNEMWALHPQVLPNYAVHVDTGESMPAELVERIREAGAFGQGFSTVEYLAAALVDLSWHALEPGEAVEAVLSFEQTILETAGFNQLVPPRYRSPYFQHTFAFGYATGYYSYLWSEKLAAYVTEWFEEQGGLSAQAGDDFRAAILAPGFSVDPVSAIQDFFGTQPGVEPLLRRRGLAAGEAA